MTGLTWLASGGALVVLALFFIRPRLGIIALAAFLPLNEHVLRPPLPGLNFETVIVGIALGLTVMRFGFRVPPLRYSGPVLAYMSVVFIGFMVMASWGPRQIPGFTAFDVFRNAKSLVFTALLFFPLYLWFGDPRDRRRLLEGVSLGLGLVAVFGLADAVLKLSASAEEGRALGLFGDPNAMGQCLAAFSLIQLHLFTRREIPTYRRGFHLFLYTLSFASVVLSLSRSAWLALVLGHGVWLLYVNRKVLLLSATALLLVLTIAFPLVPGLLRERIEATFTSGNIVFAAPGASGFEASAASRIVFYRIGGQMFLDSPIWGHGLASFKLLTPKYGARYGMLKYKDPHSLLIKLGAETGVLGLGVFLWLAVVVVRTGRSLWRASSDEGALGALLLAVGATLLVGNLLTTEFMHAHQISGFFWILFAITTRARQDVESERT